MSHWLGSLDAVRQEVCRVGKSLFDRGLVHATAGNISVRLPADWGGGHLITPTDACLGFLQPERLSLVDAQGQHMAGDAPSKTLALHRRIDAAAGPSQAATRCVIHTHSTHCVALTLGTVPLPAGRLRWPELVPALTPYVVMKVGRVPLLPCEVPGSAEVADDVAACVTAYAQAGIALRAVMLSRLGPNVWHDSPAQAMAVLEELEETAKLWQLCQGQSAPLSQAQLAALQARFGASW